MLHVYQVANFLTFITFLSANLSANLNLTWQLDVYCRLTLFSATTFLKRVRHIAIAVKNEDSRQSMCNILKKYKFHPYKMHYVQKLVHEDIENGIW